MTETTASSSSGSATSGPASGPSSGPSPTELPADFEFFDEKNILLYNEFIKSAGVRLPNPYGGFHAEWYVKGTKQSPEFKLSGYSKFGVSYSTGEEDEAHGGKFRADLFYHQDKKKDEDKEKKKEKELNVTVALPVPKNPHLETWVNTCDMIGKREYMLNSTTLHPKQKKLDPTKESDREWMNENWSSVGKVARKNKLNAERYGASVQFKINRETQIFKKSPCGKYDLDSNLDEIWKKEGDFTIFGRFYKLNLEGKYGNSMSFMANVVQFAPKKVGLGAAGKYINKAPVGYNPAPPAPAPATAAAPSAPPVQGDPASASAAAVPLGASGATTATSDTEILAVTGVVKDRPQFVPES